MGSTRRSVKSELESYLRERPTERITEEEWRRIQARFGSASPGYLRRLLRESGVPLDPLVEGVRQSGFDELERTLLALEREYSTGDADRRAECRRLAVEAKDHARWAARRAKEPEKRAAKEEMAQWILVWLEYPAAFPSWVRLRKPRMESSE